MWGEVVNNKENKIEDCRSGYVVLGKLYSKNFLSMLVV